MFGFDVTTHDIVHFISCPGINPLAPCRPHPLHHPALGRAGACSVAWLAPPAELDPVPRLHSLALLPVKTGALRDLRGLLVALIPHTNRDTLEFDLHLALAAVMLSTNIMWLSKSVAERKAREANIKLEDVQVRADTPKEQTMRGREAAEGGCGMGRGVDRDDSAAAYHRLLICASFF